MIDYSTKNQSFLDTHEELKEQGIKNNDFMLLLLDEDLKGVDLDQVSSGKNSKLFGKVQKECVANPWYYFREVLKLPIDGGGEIMFPLDQGLLAQIYVILNGQSCWVTRFRQSLKTFTGAAILDYFARYHHKSSSIIDRDLESCRNIRRKMTAHDNLPSLNASPKNSSVAVGLALDVKHSDIVLVDNAEYINCVDIITEKTFVTKDCPKNICFMYLSTINDAAEKCGALNVLRSASPWNNKLYDIGLLSGSPALYHINYHWSELNRKRWDEKWYETMERVMANPDAVRREIDCIRNQRTIRCFKEDTRLR